MVRRRLMSNSDFYPSGAGMLVILPVSSCIGWVQLQTPDCGAILGS